MTSTKPCRAPDRRPTRPSRWRALVVVCLLSVGIGACRSQPSEALSARPRRTGPVDRTHQIRVFQAGLQPGWHDFGWAKRELDTGGPARVNLEKYGGWIIASPGFAGWARAVHLKYRSPVAKDFLELRLGAADKTTFPSVKVGPAHVRELEEGWREIVVTLEELNPERRPFDRLRIRAHRSIDPGWVELDDIALVGTDAPRPPPKLEPARPARFVVDCSVPTRPISEDIYGIAFNARRDAKHGWLWQLRPTGRRWGGNSHSRYNWRLGNAWNTASDWFFENVNYTSEPDYSWTRFLDDNAAHGAKTALTIPLLGWVAKDTRSYSFPVSVYGEQEKVDPYKKDAGNGRSRDGKELAPGAPTTTSVQADAAFMAEWVRAIRKRDEASGRRSVDVYLLGNEPMLWHSTHRDVHPEPVGYDELLERTLAYGTAVRRADPEARIAGPGVWGWPAYFFSAKDSRAGFWRKPDRRAHDDEPLLSWYLNQLRTHEQKTGERILDLLDVHFYPQGDVHNDKADVETAARRIRSTRGLWDPDYVDESWIKESIRLIPRLQEIIDGSYPGLGILIGEYNFGGEEHMSGALALAEALGRFGQLGVSAAYYWTYPAEGSHAFWAFRAYRDFDGAGGRFLARSLKTEAPEGASLFASTDESGRIVAVLLNFEPRVPLDAEVVLEGCSAEGGARMFTHADGVAGLEARPSTRDARRVRAALPPYSVTVLDVAPGP